MSARGAVGVLGGSFDPPHNGHVEMARHSLEELGLARVIVIPAGSPPHKALSGSANAGQRYEMARLAFEELARAELSDMELRRQGRSYTVDTLRELKAARGQEERLYLIMGADMMMTLESWRDFDVIAGLAGIIAYPRGAFGADAIKRRARDISERYGAKCLCADRALPDISSTKVRELLHAGEDVSGIIAPAVLQFILKNEIYR